MAASKHSVFVDNFVKMKADAKSFVWNFLGNLVNEADGTVIDFNTVYCNNCLQSREIKAYNDIVSTKNLSQHFECLVKMRETSSALFVRVNTGATENSGMENARRSKSDTGKPETDTHYRIQRLTNTYDSLHTSGPSKPQTINSALRHRCRYVLRFKIIIILITTLSQCSRYK